MPAVRGVSAAIQPWRRRALLGAGLALPAWAWTAGVRSQEWAMPDEAERHLRTWMAWGPAERVWGDRLLPEVRRNLMLIANTIARFEPVTMLVRPAEMAAARSQAGPGVSLLASPLDDLWMRDTGPVFVRNEAGQRAAVNFNFNGWGGKQAHAQDTQVARRVAAQAGVPLLTTELVLEGGGIEVDGQGTAIIAESCVLNPNRNPGLSKADCEQLLMPLLGLDKIIWLPGIRGKDITDGHTDFYARFARPGLVMAGFDPDPNSHDHAVTHRHLQILRTATDARGQRLQVVVLQAPEKVRPAFEGPEFAGGYIGFYACNGAIIAQEFGDAAADRAARDALGSAFPGRQIVQLNVDGIAAGGGSIHCTTQQEPAA